MANVTREEYLEDISNDICPICKTDKYLNSNMKFLINPECYHKMCDACVDRIFLLGPTKCPYKDCDKILRKSKFKTQIFEDINVEKEIDVRKRILKIFNKVEDDFPTLDEYNQYLEKVEEIIFNLLNNIDVKETSDYVEQYKRDNQKLIYQNNINLQKQHDFFLRAENQKKLLNEQKAQLSKQLIKQLRNDEKLAKQQITNSLLNSALSSDAIVANARRNLLKQTSARQKRFNEEARQLQEQFLAQGIDELELLSANGRGWKQKRKPALSPFTPFNGDREPAPKFDMEQDYYDPYIANIASDKQYMASGVRAEQIYKKCLFEAFFGLDCIIKDEKAELS